MPVSGSGGSSHLCSEMPRSGACSRPRPEHAAGGRAGHEIRESESASPQQSARNSRSEVPRIAQTPNAHRARSLLHIIQILEACGFDLFIDRQSMDTTTPMGRSRELLPKPPFRWSRGLWRVLAQTGNYPQSESMRFRCRSPMCTPRSRSRSASSLPQSTFCRMRGPNRTGRAVTDGCWGASSPLGPLQKRCPALPRSNV